jgi:predicted nucleic acid-binding protein
MRVFIDTWGWVALHNVREAHHAEVREFYENCRHAGEEIYTSDYVLDEAFTLLFLRTPFEKAVEAMERINRAGEAGYLLIESIDAARFDEAKDLRRRYSDKPKISFTDLTSMVVMEEQGIERVISQDAHFTYVESGFRLVPEIGHSG